MSGEPPPLYTPDILDGDDGPDPDDGEVDPQILIIPTSSDAEFQKGYLGVEGERAAIEGELQIKGIRASACQKVYVSFQSLSIPHLIDSPVRAN
jgi:neural Wiskott-Aldrich syndrome protein